jgi:hypothetical protein
LVCTVEMIGPSRSAGADRDTLRIHSRASGAANASHVWNAFPRDGAGRDALPRDPRQDVRW